MVRASAATRSLIAGELSSDRRAAEASTAESPTEAAPDRRTASSIRREVRQRREICPSRRRQIKTGNRKKFMEFFFIQVQEPKRVFDIKNVAGDPICGGIFVDDVQAPKAGEGRRTP